MSPDREYDSAHPRGAPHFGSARGPLPLLDLQRYAEKFGGMGEGVDGIEDRELVKRLAYVLSRIAMSLEYVMRGSI